MSPVDSWWSIVGGLTGRVVPSRSGSGGSGTPGDDSESLTAPSLSQLLTINYRSSGGHSLRHHDARRGGTDAGEFLLEVFQGALQLPVLEGLGLVQKLAVRSAEFEGRRGRRVRADHVRPTGGVLELLHLDEVPCLFLVRGGPPQPLVRRHAPLVRVLLRGRSLVHILAVGPPPRLGRQLHRALLVRGEAEEALHAPLAVRPLADDGRPPVVLEGRGDDLAGAGAGAIHE